MTHPTLDDQVRRLLDLGYAELAGLTPAELTHLCAPLADVVDGLEGPEPSPPDDLVVPYLLVVGSGLVPTVEAVSRWSVRGRPGWTDMADELASYAPIPEVVVPDAPVYLLTDVRSGRDTLGVRPSEAQPRLLGGGRTPLTIDEGVALLTQCDVLDTHHAFQALASRAGNARVPTFWFSKGAPRLGWCWWNNPHSWLGAASGAERLSG